VKKNILRIIASLTILSLLIPTATIQARPDPISVEATSQEVEFTGDPNLPEGLSSSEWKSMQSQISNELYQQAFLKPGWNTWWEDPFGFSVAISGDTAVVSQRDGHDYPHFESASHVYIFVRTGGDWTLQRFISSDADFMDDEFGHSVAIDGDTIVVGRPNYGWCASTGDGDCTESKARAGSAYVFVRSGTIWTQEAHLKASNADFYDSFGTSVAISGDTIVVGAIGEDSNATSINGDQSDNSVSGAGAAYVFVRNGATWVQQAYLKASNTAESNHLGTSVAISGDTIVVGNEPYCSEYDDCPNQTHALTVFVRESSTWYQQAFLIGSNTDDISNTNQGDEFGGSVSISGDTIVVGARYEDSNSTGVNGDESNNDATRSGAAYVFVRSGTTWSQQAYLKASNTDTFDEFGGSVSISGDTIIVGAMGEDSSATGVNGNQSDNSAGYSGAAYVFVRSGTTWTQQAYLKASNTEEGDRFGDSVAVSGDTYVVSATGEDSATGINGDQSNNDSPECGAAYVFAGETSPSDFQVDLDVSSSTVILSDYTSQNMKNQPYTTVLETVVHNYGPDSARQVNVQLFNGPPDSGTLIASKMIDELGSNVSIPVRIDLKSFTSPIDADVYIKVETADIDTDLSNNISNEGTSVFIAFADFTYLPDGFSFENFPVDWDYFKSVLFQYSHLVFPLNLQFEHSFAPWLYVITAAGGACYGMASSSMGYWEDPSLKPVDKDTYQMTLLESRENIYSHHIRQLIKDVPLSLLGFGNNPSATFIDIKNRLVEEPREPAIFGLQERALKLSDLISGTNLGGHSVLAYKITEIGNKNAIFVYDSNDPENPSLEDYVPYANIMHLDQSTNSIKYVNYDLEYKVATATSPVRTPSEITKNMLEDFINLYLRSLIQENFMQGFFSWGGTETLINSENEVDFTSGSTVTGEVLSNFLISDEKGNALGFIDGQLINTIPGAIIEIMDSSLYWLLPANGTYSMETTGIGTTDVVLSLAIPQSASLVQSTIYEGFSVPQGSTATTEFSQNTTDWKIEIEGQADVLPDIEEEIPVEYGNGIFLPLVIK
jgi:hypothetical protein